MEHCTPQPAAPGVSLTVLPGSNVRRKSRMGKKRALVLTGVWLFMILHVIQWLAMGSTLAPVEPSEGMQTVKDGVITMGAIFFIAALASTALLGRWFCGWGCHIVGLQDGTSWLLKKIGVRPKPFRSRLLLWIPFLLAFYMFIWPVFYRLAVAPWLKQPVPWNGLSLHLTTNDFWATFPGVLVAVPFLLICGCIVIYFLGAKGYCTYACPYGGFFAPVDEIAPMRIVVDADKCHQCGHCTAVCTSNVRVHEEVRDYGMVVDPGCMKCMDCVSVCPNNALSFGVGKPAFRIQRAGTPAAAAAARRYDLTWPEEIALFALAVLTFLSVRGTLLGMPLLFASGFTMCVVFIVWKAWRVIHDPNAAFHQWQLRFHGKWRAAGAAWVGGAAAMLLLVGYVGVLNGTLALADRADLEVNVPAEVVYSDQRTEPAPDVAQTAREALRYFQLASAPPDGFNILPLAQTHIDFRSSWLHSVLGEFPQAEARLRAIWQREGPSQELAAALGRVIRVQGERVHEAMDWYDQQLAAHPEWQDLRQEQIFWLQYVGESDRVLESARNGYKAMPNDLRAMRQYSLQLVEFGKNKQEIADGVNLIERTLTIEPNNAAAYAALGRGYLKLERRDDAIHAFKQAVILDPKSALYRGMLEEVQNSEENPMTN